MTGDSGLDQPDADLYDAAREAAGRAYAPYSGYAVGAALRTADGTVFTGCNVENASYGLAICAERTACVAAVAAGHTNVEAVAVHVDTDDGQPCGACRQFLSEFGPQMTVIYRSGGAVVSASLTELLPDMFDPRTLTQR
jgi:cytidine deaminase